ncbi:helix-turn-helix domain-containing protein [Leptospira adleri]|uniref:helix-turn-helix domain-containing protein n=1 Tax=Leptospira adleri TaxID=2023186 RepID=UPI00108489BE|nr:helix-turn-helix domain-containing protein [Leptospira adleri]TGM61681.1 DNA-binding protein [Leptospira adleri]
MLQKRNDEERNVSQEIKSKAVNGYSREGSLYNTSLNQDRKSERTYKGLSADPVIPKNPNDTMTPKEVAVLLKRTVRRVGDYRREGLLGKFWRLRDGRILYSRVGVEEFFRKHFVETEEDF